MVSKGRPIGGVIILMSPLEMIISLVAHKSHLNASRSIYVNVPVCEWHFEGNLVSVAIIFAFNAERNQSISIPSLCFGKGKREILIGQRIRHYFVDVHTRCNYECWTQWQWAIRRWFARRYFWAQPVARVYVCGAAFMRERIDGQLD